MFPKVFSFFKFVFKVSFHSKTEKPRKNAAQKGCKDFDGKNYFIVLKVTIEMVQVAPP